MVSFRSAVLLALCLATAAAFPTSSDFVFTTLSTPRAGETFLLRVETTTAVGDLTAISLTSTGAPCIISNPRVNADGVQNANVVFEVMPLAPGFINFAATAHDVLNFEVDAWSPPSVTSDPETVVVSCASGTGILTVTSYDDAVEVTYPAHVTIRATDAAGLPCPGVDVSVVSAAIPNVDVLPATATTNDLGYVVFSAASNIPVPVLDNYTASATDFTGATFSIDHVLSFSCPAITNCALVFCTSASSAVCRSCNPGFFGSGTPSCIAECADDSFCFFNGDCVSGTCQCEAPFTGDNCSTVPDLVPVSSGQTMKIAPCSSVVFEYTPTANSFVSYKLERSTEVVRVYADDTPAGFPGTPGVVVGKYNERFNIPPMIVAGLEAYESTIFGLGGYDQIDFEIDGSLETVWVASPKVYPMSFWVKDITFPPSNRVVTAIVLSGANIFFLKSIAVTGTLVGGNGVHAIVTDSVPTNPPAVTLKDTALAQAWLGESASYLDVSCGPASGDTQYIVVKNLDENFPAYITLTPITAAARTTTTLASGVSSTSTVSADSRVYYEFPIDSTSPAWGVDVSVTVNGISEGETFRIAENVDAIAGDNPTCSDVPAAHVVSSSSDTITFRVSAPSNPIRAARFARISTRDPYTTFLGPNDVDIRVTYNKHVFKIDDFALATRGNELFFDFGAELHHLSATGVLEMKLIGDWERDLVVTLYDGTRSFIYEEVIFAAAVDFEQDFVIGGHCNVRGTPDTLYLTGFADFDSDHTVSITATSVTELATAAGQFAGSLQSGETKLYAIPDSSSAKDVDVTIVGVDNGAVVASVFQATGDVCFDGNYATDSCIADRLGGPCFATPECTDKATAPWLVAVTSTHPPLDPTRPTYFSAMVSASADYDVTPLTFGQAHHTTLFGKDETVFRVDVPTDIDEHTGVIFRIAKEKQGSVEMDFIFKSYTTNPSAAGSLFNTCNKHSQDMLERVCRVSSDDLSCEVAIESCAVRRGSSYYFTVDSDTRSTEQMFTITAFLNEPQPLLQDSAGWTRLANEMNGRVFYFDIAPEDLLPTTTLSIISSHDVSVAPGFISSDSGCCSPPTFFDDDNDFFIHGKCLKPGRWYIAIEDVGDHDVPEPFSIAVNVDQRPEDEVVGATVVPEYSTARHAPSVVLQSSTAHVGYARIPVSAEFAGVGILTVIVESEGVDMDDVLFNFGGLGHPNSYGYDCNEDIMSTSNTENFYHTVWCDVKEGDYYIYVEVPDGDTLNVRVTAFFEPTEPVALELDTPATVEINTRRMFELPLLDAFEADWRGHLEISAYFTDVTGNPGIGLALYPENHQRHCGAALDADDYVVVPADVDQQRRLLVSHCELQGRSSLLFGAVWGTADLLFADVTVTVRRIEPVVVRENEPVFFSTMVGAAAYFEFTPTGTHPIGSRVRWVVGYNDGDETRLDVDVFSKEVAHNLFFDVTHNPCALSQNERACVPGLAAQVLTLTVDTSTAFDDTVTIMATVEDPIIINATEGVAATTTFSSVHEGAHVFRLPAASISAGAAYAVHVDVLSAGTVEWAVGHGAPVDLDSSCYVPSSAVFGTDGVLCDGDADLFVTVRATAISLITLDVTVTFEEIVPLTITADGTLFNFTYADAHVRQGDSNNTFIHFAIDVSAATPTDAFDYLQVDLFSADVLSTLYVGTSGPIAQYSSCSDTIDSCDANPGFGAKCRVATADISAGSYAGNSFRPGIYYGAIAIKDVGAVSIAAKRVSIPATSLTLGVASVVSTTSVLDGFFYGAVQYFTYTAPAAADRPITVVTTGDAVGIHHGVGGFPTNTISHPGVIEGCRSCSADKHYILVVPAIAGTVDYTITVSSPVATALTAGSTFANVSAAAFTFPDTPWIADITTFSPGSVFVYELENCDFSSLGAPSSLSYCDELTGYALLDARTTPDKEITVFEAVTAALTPDVPRAFTGRQLVELTWAAGDDDQIYFVEFDTAVTVNCDTPDTEGIFVPVCISDAPTRAIVESSGDFNATLRTVPTVTLTSGVSYQHVTDGATKFSTFRLPVDNEDHILRVETEDSIVVKVSGDMSPAFSGCEELTLNGPGSEDATCTVSRRTRNYYSIVVEDASFTNFSFTATLVPVFTLDADVTTDVKEGEYYRLDTAHGGGRLTLATTCSETASVELYQLLENACDYKYTTSVAPSINTRRGVPGTIYDSQSIYVLDNGNSWLLSVTSANAASTLHYAPAVVPVQEYIGGQRWERSPEDPREMQFRFHAPKYFDFEHSFTYGCGEDRCTFQIAGPAGTYTTDRDSWATGTLQLNNCEDGPLTITFDGAFFYSIPVARLMTTRVYFDDNNVAQVHGQTDDDGYNFYAFELTEVSPFSRLMLSIDDEDDGIEIVCDVYFGHEGCSGDSENVATVEQNDRDAIAYVENPKPGMYFIRCDNDDDRTEDFTVTITLEEVTITPVEMGDVLVFTLAPWEKRYFSFDVATALDVVRSPGSPFAGYEVEVSMEDISGLPEGSYYFGKLPDDSDEFTDFSDVLDEFKEHPGEMMYMAIHNYDEDNFLKIRLAVGSTTAPTTTVESALDQPCSMSSGATCVYRAPSSFGFWTFTVDNSVTVLFMETKTNVGAGTHFCGGDDFIAFSSGSSVTASFTAANATFLSRDAAPTVVQSGIHFFAVRRSEFADVPFGSITANFNKRASGAYSLDGQNTYPTETTVAFNDFSDTFSSDRIVHLLDLSENNDQDEVVYFSVTTDECDLEVSVNSTYFFGPFGLDFGPPVDTTLGELTNSTFHLKVNDLGFGSLTVPELADVTEPTLVKIEVFNPGSPLSAITYDVYHVMDRTEDFEDSPLSESNDAAGNLFDVVCPGESPQWYAVGGIYNYGAQYKVSAEAIPHLSGTGGSITASMGNAFGLREYKMFAFNDVLHLTINVDTTATVRFDIYNDPCPASGEPVHQVLNYDSGCVATPDSPCEFETVTAESRIDGTTRYLVMYSYNSFNYTIDYSLGASVCEAPPALAFCGGSGGPVYNSGRSFEALDAAARDLAHTMEASYLRDQNIMGDCQAASDECIAAINSYACAITMPSCSPDDNTVLPVCDFICQDIAAACGVNDEEGNPQTISAFGRFEDLPCGPKPTAKLPAPCSAGPASVPRSAYGEATDGAEPEAVVEEDDGGLSAGIIVLIVICCLLFCVLVLLGIYALYRNGQDQKNSTKPQDAETAALESEDVDSVDTDDEVDTGDSDEDEDAS